MAKTSILISNSWLTSADLVFHNYSESAYDAVGAIDFQLAVIARHVAVYNEDNNISGLSLAEVEVFGYWVLRL